jgi:broad specificity phosphatase PhoE
MKDIYFVRHGQAEGNEAAVFKSPNAALTLQGLDEAAVLAQKTAVLQPGHIVFGPLSRTVDTAKIIADTIGIPYSIHDAFAGIKHASSMAGQPKDGPVAEAYLATIKKMYSDDPNARYEDAENYTDLHTRLCAGLQHLAAHEADNILVVSHESVIKSYLILILHNLAYTPAFNIDMKKHLGKMTNTGITHVTFDDTWKIVSYNQN